MKTTQEKIEKKEKELKELKEKLKTEQDNKSNSNKSEWVSIPKTNYEVTKEVLHKGKSYKEIMKLKKQGEELLTLKLIGIICEHPNLIKELKMDSSSTNDDFFFEQPFPQDKERGYVAGFYAGSGYAYLGCGGGSDDWGSALGVRFVRKIKSKKNK